MYVNVTTDYLRYSDSSASERSEEGEGRRGRGKKTMKKESNLILSSTPDILTFNPSLTDSINPSLTDNIKPLAENLNPSLTDGLNPSLTDNLNPSLTENINPSLTEETQSTMDDELVRGTRRLRVKEEEGEGACPMTMPEATPNTSASSFISSLKVYSRTCALYTPSKNFNQLLCILYPKCFYLRNLQLKL